MNRCPLGGYVVTGETALPTDPIDHDSPAPLSWSLPNLVCASAGHGPARGRQMFAISVKRRLESVSRPTTGQPPALTEGYGGRLYSAVARAARNMRPRATRNRAPRDRIAAVPWQCAAMRAPCPTRSTAASSPREPRRADHPRAGLGPRGLSATDSRAHRIHPVHARLDKTRGRRGRRCLAAGLDDTDSRARPRAASL